MFSLELLLSASLGFVKAIEMCWDERVFLSALSHRFWKLTLQVRILPNLFFLICIQMIYKYKEWMILFLAQEEVNVKEKLATERVFISLFRELIFLKIKSPKLCRSGNGTPTNSNTHQISRAVSSPNPNPLSVIPISDETVLLNCLYAHHDIKLMRGKVYNF